MKTLRLLIYLLLFLILSACSQNPFENKQISFYHWKTFPDDKLQLREYLDQGPTDKLYYRFFDLKTEGQRIVPVAQAQIDTGLINNKSVAACIFISNDCFSNTYREESKGLAERCLQKINFMLQEKNLTKQWDELQIDCDWTQSTKENYFKFLSHLKELLPEEITLSATIRLHQVKYPDKTGVPPVDKGSLMCYNMDDIADLESPNSIYNTSILKTYIDSKSSYPLSLDIALPLFEWHLLFRDGSLQKIINQEIGNLNELKYLGENRYQLEQDQYLAGHYVYKGDLLKKEGINTDDLRSALRILKDSRLQIADNIVFYHLNEKLTTSFPYDTLQQLVLDSH